MDPEYKDLIEHITKGNRLKTPLVLQLKKILTKLSTDNGIVLWGKRIIIPKMKRSELLNNLHAAHQGIEKNQRRARTTVHWPGITNEIVQMIERCTQCQISQASNPKETMTTNDPPNRAFEESSADLFELSGNHYMIYVDRYYGFLFVSQWKHLPISKEVIFKLIDWFSITGIPTKFRSDGGTQFSSFVFQQFLKNSNVSWAPSTPTYVQSNGLAEITVKSIKRILSKLPTKNINSEEFQWPLLEFRKTPRSEGKSPCEHLYQRPTRSIIPTHNRHYESLWQVDTSQADMKIRDLKTKSSSYYNRSAKDLCPIPIGAAVRIQDNMSR